MRAYERKSSKYMEAVQERTKNNIPATHIHSVVVVHIVVHLPHTISIHRELPCTYRVCACRRMHATCVLSRALSENTQRREPSEWMILIQIHSEIHSIHTPARFGRSLWVFVCRPCRLRARQRARDGETPHEAADTNVRLWEQQKRAKEFYACIGERDNVYTISFVFFSLVFEHYMCFEWFFCVVVALFGLSYTHIQS